ncbi:hypothetical protein CL614_06755 [archaeon]|nr:hypothetical protein [archaeon]|tara:strand:+ start:5535 stop:6233 length:699 start_codon:yes stop_codon:yes gene_type:complete
MKTIYIESIDLMVDLIPKCGYNTFSHLFFELGGGDMKKMKNRKKKEKERKIEIQKKKDKIIVIRNPLTRLTSGFSNKHNRWAPRSRIKELSGKYDRGKDFLYSDFVCFLDFLEAEAHKHGQPRDHHFSPMYRQARSIGHYKRIFCLEDTKSIYQFLDCRASTSTQKDIIKNYLQDDVRLNETNSWNRYSHYLDDKNLERVVSLYKSDFDLFGYSQKKKDVFKVPRICKEILK